MLCNIIPKYDVEWLFYQAIAKCITVFRDTSRNLFYVAFASSRYLDLSEHFVVSYGHIDLGQHWLR